MNYFISSVADLNAKVLVWDVYVSLHLQRNALRISSQVEYRPVHLFGFPLRLTCGCLDVCFASTCLRIYVEGAKIANSRLRPPCVAPLCIDLDRRGRVFSCRICVSAKSRKVG